MLGVQKGWVAHRIRTGEIEGFPVGKKYRVTRAALEKFQENLKKKYRQAVDNHEGIYARKKWGEPSKKFEPQKAAV